MSDKGFIVWFVFCAIVGVTFWLLVGYAIWHILTANGIVL